MSPAWIRTRRTSKGERRHYRCSTAGAGERGRSRARARSEPSARRASATTSSPASWPPAGTRANRCGPTRLRAARSKTGSPSGFGLIDGDERTRENYRVHWKRIGPRFARRRPDDIEHGEVQDWINEQATVLTPAVVRDYLGTFRQILDQTRVEPNPARHRALRLPTAERPVHTPPSDEHVLALLDRMPRERRLLFIFLEQTGARLGESLSWTWGGVDMTNARILSRPENVKGRRGCRRPRWVQVPEWLLEILVATCPPDERASDRPLFTWPLDVGHPRQKVEKVMAKACAAAGIPHYHPHDLRHRRITLWHGQGIPAREIGERVGQRQVSTTLDVYTHACRSRRYRLRCIGRS